MEPESDIELARRAMLDAAELIHQATRAATDRAALDLRDVSFMLGRLQGQLGAIDGTAWRQPRNVQGAPARAGGTKQPAAPAK